MKKNTLLTVIFLIVLFMKNGFSDTITLNKALENKMIQVAIKGADKTENTASYTPSYTGLCIQMDIVNLSDKTIKVYLEAGRFLQPDDSAVQRMIVTKEQMITLERKTTKKMKIAAMCSEMNDRSPGVSTLFLLGKKADGKLLELAQLISKNNFQSNAAQSAVWAMTDDNDFNDIYSENKTEMDILRNFVKKAKGIKDNPSGNSPFNLKNDPNGTFLHYTKSKLQGSFQFEINENMILSLNLYNDKGEIARKTLQNYTFKKGTNRVKYEFEYLNVQLGNYYLKLEDDKGKVLINKFLTFK